MNLKMLEALRLQRHRGIDILILLAREEQAMSKNEIIKGLGRRKGNETRKWIDRLVEAGWLEEIDEWPRKYRLAEIEKLKMKLFPDR